MKTSIIRNASSLTDAEVLAAYNAPNPAAAYFGAEDKAGIVIAKVDDRGHLIIMDSHDEGSAPVAPILKEMTEEIIINLEA